MGVKISNLPAIAAPALSDIFPVVQAGVTYKETITQLSALLTASVGTALTRTNDTNVTVTLGGSPNTALVNAASLTMGWTGLLAITRGGTGVGSVTIAPTANSFAGWDANNNLSANNFLAGGTSITSAAGTTVLTVASTYYQIVTGSTTQTITMPVVSTLALYSPYRIDNTSSGNVTVQSSGANTIQVMGPGSSLFLTNIAITGTTAASWQPLYIIESDVSGAVLLSPSATQTITSHPLVVSAGISAPTILDSNLNTMLGFNTVSSAVNYVGFFNNVTGMPPYVIAQGSDTNIQLNISSKGTGAVEFLSGASSNQFSFLSGGGGVQSNFNMAATATRAYTFPDTTGTVGLIIADTTWTPVLTSSGGGTATYSNQAGTYTQIGNIVFFECSLILSGLPSSGTLSITGLPVTPGSLNATPTTFSTALQATVTSPVGSIILGGSPIIYLQKYATGGYASLTVADCTTTSQFFITGFYHI